jgi:hypothetical protein
MPAPLAQCVYFHQARRKSAVCGASLIDLTVMPKVQILGQILVEMETTWRLKADGHVSRITPSLRACNNLSCFSDTTMNHCLATPRDVVSHLSPDELPVIV